MSYPINLKEFKNRVYEGNFNEQNFKSKEYYFSKIAFALLSSIEDFINDLDEEKSLFILKNKKEWFKFLDVYYNRMNITKNIMKEVLSGNNLENSQIEDLKECILWTFGILEGIFKETEEPPHVVSSLFGGKLYNAFFYYTRSIDSFVQKKLNMVEDYMSVKRDLSMILDERKEIDEISKTVEENENSLEELPELTKAKILGMWIRAVGFVNNEMFKEKHFILNEYKYKLGTSK